jgi:penicillin-binding protein 1A
MFRRITNKPLRYFVILIYFILLTFFAIELNFLWLFGYSPNIRDIKTPNMRLPSELYTADGKLIGRYYKENRTPVEFNQIAPSAIDALVATEDVRFYKHSGIDLISMVSSAVSTVSGDKRGASTITQQLAKNLYRTRNQRSQGAIKYIPLVRTVIYKFKELITALKLEGYYTKDQILTLYLNTVPFGSNTYGIKVASKRYFDKEPLALEVEQSATLIGMLKANTTYNPLLNPEKSLERRNVVLAQMEKYGYLTAAEFEKYSRRNLKITRGEFEEGVEGDSYLRAAVESYLERWVEDSGYDLYESGLKIYTTIDSRMQEYAEQAVKSQMPILQRRLNNEWSGEDPWRDSENKPIERFAETAAKRLPYYADLKKRFNNNPDSIKAYLNRPKKMKVFSWDGEKEVTFSTLDSIEYYSRILNTGMMTLDPQQGHIKVWVGGINNEYFKFDHVKQAKRQAGSTFKPFAYLAALEAGMNPCDKLIDRPVKISYQDGNETKFWEPKNASASFTGQEMTLRRALARSVNSITAQVTEQVGWDKVVEYAHKCGIESDLKSVPSVSLGPNDVSVFEMVTAYGTFLNKGNKIQPILVQRITDNDGNKIAEFEPKQERAISEEIAWLMLYMLRGGMEERGGTSQALWEWDLFKKGNQIAGKTGTSSDYVDGWYMGLTKDLVTGVWVGCDERSVHFRTSDSGEGSKTALPIFAKFMEKVYRDPSIGYTYATFPKPGTTINREYNCAPESIEIDTFSVDSFSADTFLQNMPVETPIVDTPKTEDPLAPKSNERPAEPAKPTETTPPVKTEEPTKAETRRERRQQRRINKQE